MSTDITKELQQQLEHAFDNETLINVKGMGSKSFYGRNIASNIESLDTTQHTGIMDYQPTELVITARCGTPLSEINAALDERQQMLAFDPPQFNNTGSVGGMVACGLSGPSRPFAGSVRDAVLGVTCLNGKAEKLVYGGQVMKNVAGYDISRLMTGSMGTLGVILNVSLKVMPKPEAEVTLILEKNFTQALATWRSFDNRALPITASCQLNQRLYIRLSGNKSATDHAQSFIGGEVLDASDDFWQQLRDHQLAFFDDPRPLWRISLAPATMMLNIDGDTLTDWAGAQRWIKTNEPAAVIRQLASAQGGHATLFNPADNTIEAFQPLATGLLKLHQQIKHAFDPAGILNKHRMSADY